MGFSSLNDFFNSLFGIKHADFNFIIVLGTTITSLITNYMWDTPSAIYTLWSLMAVDWLTGIIKAMKNKEFISSKLYRMPLFFLSTSAIISFSWWIAKTSLIFHLLPSIVMGGFLSVYFISLLENLADIGLLPKTMVTVLKARFGFKTLIKKFENNG